LGVEKFGLVMFAQSLGTFFLIAVGFGFDISGTREIAISKNNKEQLSQMFSAIMTIKFFLIVFWLCVLFLVVEFIPRFKEDSLVYYLSYGMVVGHAIFPVWFFQGIEKMKFVTLINILAKLIFTILIFVVIKNKSDYYLVPAFNAIGFISAGFIGFLISLKHINLVKPPFRLIIKLFKDSFSLFVGKFATNLYTTCNVLVLGLFAGDTIVGVYSSMEKLLLAIKNIYAPFYQAIFPWLSNQLPEKRIRVLKKITPYITGVGTIITLGILFFGDAVLAIIYNDELINSYSYIFKTLGLIGVLSGLNMMFTSLYFPAVKMYKTRMNIFLIAGFSHLILSLILVKKYDIDGTMIAVLITEILLLVLGFYYYRKHLKLEKITL
jgi:PST family polysaccharide transporter